MSSEKVFCSRLLASGDSSGAATPSTEAGLKGGALQETIAALEQHFASRSLFRRFVSARCARGAQMLEACGSQSFLNATAGILR
jgi:hypothetical protein